MSAYKLRDLNRTEPNETNGINGNHLLFDATMIESSERATTYLSASMQNGLYPLRSINVVVVVVVQAHS